MINALHNEQEGFNVQFPEQSVAFRFAEPDSYVQDGNSDGDIGSIERNPDQDELLQFGLFLNSIKQLNCCIPNQPYDEIGDPYNATVEDPISINEAVFN